MSALKLGYDRGHPCYNKTILGSKRPLSGIGWMIGHIFREEIWLEQFALAVFEKIKFLCMSVLVRIFFFVVLIHKKSNVLYR